MQQPKTYKREFFPVMDGIRGFVALWVLGIHFTFHNLPISLFEENSILKSIFLNTEPMVVAFFVISGFLIPYSLMLNNFQFKSYFRYLLKRILRIEPVYLCSILLILMVSLAFAFYNNETIFLDPIRFLYHIGYLIPFSDYKWYNIIYWTLALEFQFYLLLPFVFILLRKSQITFWIAFSIFCLGPVLVDHDIYVFHYFSIFGFGILLFGRRFYALNYIIEILILIILIAITAMFINAGSAIVSAFTYFIILFIKESPKWLNYIGKISYSLYVTHGVIGGNILYFFIKEPVPQWQGFIWWTISILASILFAHFFYKLIESPSIRWSKKIKY